MQDRGLDQGCFAVCKGMSWVESAGAVVGAEGGLSSLDWVVFGFWIGGLS